MADVSRVTTTRPTVSTSAQQWESHAKQASREIDIENVVDGWFEASGTYSRKEEDALYGFLDRMDLNKNGFVNLEEFYRVLDPAETGDKFALSFEKDDAGPFIGGQPVYVADWESQDGEGSGKAVEAWQEQYGLLRSLMTFLQEDRFLGQVEIVQVATSAPKPDFRVPQPDVGGGQSVNEAQAKAIALEGNGKTDLKKMGNSITEISVGENDSQNSEPPDWSYEGYREHLESRGNADDFLEVAREVGYEIESLDDLHDFDGDQLRDLDTRVFQHRISNLKDSIKTEILDVKTRFQNKTHSMKFMM